MIIDNSYTPQALDSLTYKDVYMVIDFVENGNVFFRRWAGDVFTGLLRVPVDDFASQAVMVGATMERTATTDKHHDPADFPPELRAREFPPNSTTRGWIDGIFPSI